MTYIAAFGQPGLNAIIADTRVTWSSGTGVPDDPNIGLKVGLLFPGCIYGITAKDAAAARKFILRFKQSIQGSTNTILGFWHQFERFVEIYEFPPASQQFQLVLSHRGSGIPRFAVLDSEAGLDQTMSSQGNHLSTYGSGCTVLDPILTQELMPRFDEKHRKFLLQVVQVPEALIPYLSPYFLCLWLNEKSLTFDVPKLHAKGVGGLFHFVWQNADTEEPQLPAVYIFSMIERASNTVRSWVFRVAPVHGGLYIEEYHPETDSVIGKAIFDNAAYDVGVLSDAELQQFVERELAALPYFNFLGVGFIDPSERRRLIFRLSPHGKREDICDSGTLARNLRIAIDENFGSIRIFPPSEYK